MPSPSDPPADGRRHLPGWLTALIERAAQVDGQQPFSDQSLVELAAGGRELLAIGEDAAAVASAAEAELVVHPDARHRGLGAALLSSLLERAREGLLIWAHGNHPDARALARRFGLEPVRTLLQLRAAVDDPAGFDTAAILDESLRDQRHARSPAIVRLDQRSAATASRVPAQRAYRDQPTAFRPGIDDVEWLALNAKAFAHHPEQGTLTQRDLDARLAEDWFDARDFLLLRDGNGAMAAFCWLKIEHGLGEFYAVGVDPDRQGEGLGRALMKAGFARLAERGIREANLYVDADNEPAVRLYRSFGFADHSVDLQYRLRGSRSG